MDAREGSVRQGGGDDAITTRLGAAALPLGVVVLVVAETLHPSREDPMDNPAVFAEYADSDIWTVVHLLEYFGFLLLLGGLVALYYSLKERPGVGAGLAPFGLAAAVTTAASFTVLQAVDGIALKRTVDAWASAPADREAVEANFCSWQSPSRPGFLGSPTSVILLHRPNGRSWSSRGRPSKRIAARRNPPRLGSAHLCSEKSSPQLTKNVESCGFSPAKCHCPHGEAQEWHLFSS